MSDSAFMTQYRDEFVAAFEQRQSYLRDTVTTEAEIHGNQAVFLVAGSGSATAVTRGLSGRIPARSDVNTQNTCTLQEWHDLVRKTNFNVTSSQGNQRAIMQQTTMAVINRKIDDLIVTQLNTGTVTIGGTSQIPTINFFQNARVKLSNASVPWDSNITLLCQPSFLGYLEQTTEFTNAQYVNLRPYAGDDDNWRDQPPAYRWKNVLVLEHPNLPGKGTTSEKSFLFHKTSAGHAINMEGLDMDVGYVGEQAYSYARASAGMGALLLQNTGVVVMTHDGTGLA